MVPRRHKPPYSPEQIAALVDYTYNLVGGGGPDIPHVTDGNLAEGGELFRLQCAACHAWAGDGGALFQREAPPLHDLTPREVAEAVRVGPDGMPAFGQAAVSDHQINSLVAYVLSLGSLRNRGGQPLWHLGPLVEGGVALFVGAPLLWLVIRRIGGHE
jgi:ubiquinol-cytochrome c reductase cytochrome c subunit